MNRAFPIPGPVAALASSRPGRLRGAELSIVSILDGEIGDPITWMDEPKGSMVDHAAASEAPLFEAVAEDIGAHLPTGVVLVHRPDSALALLRRALPWWRPALAVDTLSLAECTQTSADRHHVIGNILAVPSAEAGLRATAERAVATAHLVLRLLATPESICLNWGREQAEYAHRFQ